MKKLTLLCLAPLVLIGAGCGSKTDATNSTSDIAIKSDYVDSSLTEHHNLGSLGALGNPVADVISFPDPADKESMVSPGAIVIREVSDGHVAATAGLKVGDVIVRVGDDWLPVKDDPTPDLVASFEASISAGAKTIELGILRDGAYETLSASHGLKSLDDGLPTDVVRFSTAADAAVKRLIAKQNKDGSFGSEKSPIEQRIQTTSLAGLAFLAAGNDTKQNAKKCAEFVGQQIDKRSKATTPPKKKENKTDGGKTIVMQMSMPEVDLDPLSAAYVLQFLAESDSQMTDQGWMKRMLGLTGAIRKSQAESGGWGVADDAEDGAVDVVGTHTTNQVVSAMGAMERKGVMGDADSLKKACAYLKAQAAARADSGLDRRTKAVLSAGTAAALVAISCKTSDQLFQDLSKECFARVEDLSAAPSLSQPGLLSTAIVARAGGNETWTQFHNAAKVVLVSSQSPDGRFHTVPGVKAESVVGADTDEIWQAAHQTLTLAMQHGRLKKLTGRTSVPMMAITRNSAGEKVAGGSEVSNLPAGIPAGAKVMKFELGDLSGEGSLEDQIKEKLKEQGIDVGNMKIQSSTVTEKKKKGDNK